MLKRYFIDESRIRETEDEESPILLFFNPDENEKKFLVEEFEIEEHSIQSALDPNELSRLEFETSHIAIIFKRPKNYSSRDQLVFKVSTMGIFYFGDRIVLISSEEFNVFEGKIFQKAESLLDILLKMISQSINHFMEHIKVINMITDELENKISISMENKYLLSLFAIEKSLIFYLNAIDANNILINKMKRYAEKITFNEEQIDSLDDISIENNQCYRQAEIYSNIIAGLMDARASIINLNLNILMKTLNFITITIMVPTLVVSAFSMNVDLPFHLQNSPYAFWIIMGMALISIVLVMAIWKKFDTKEIKRKKKKRSLQNN